MNFDGLCKCSISSKQVNTFLFSGKSSFLTVSKKLCITFNFFFLHSFAKKGDGSMTITSFFIRLEISLAKIPTPPPISTQL